MSFSIVKLIGLATIAVLGASYAPGSSALSLEAHNFIRHDHAARHGMISKRQSAPANRRRCKARTSTLTSSVASGPSSSSNGSPQAASTTSSSTWVNPTTKPASTKAPTPVETPAPPKPPTTGGGGKAGVVYNRQVDVARFVSGSRKISAVANWSPYKDPAMMSQLPGVEFVPQFWGLKQGEDMRKFVKPGYANHILAMNEPDQAGQSNMSPQRGVELWNEWIQPLKSQGYVLVSPSTTNAESGVAWLEQFVAACHGCSIDRIGAHFYGTTVDAFQKHVRRLYNAFGRQLWVTEFACHNFGSGGQPSRDEVFNFLRATTRWMDTAHEVEKYFWFGVLDNVGMNNVNLNNQLINPDSSPNALGLIYLGLAD